jgi:alkylated DNA repair dioxygenase AlkB
MKLAKEVINQGRQILPKDGDVRYFAPFFTVQDSQTFLTELLEKIEWRQEAIVLFGRKVMQPRLTAWYGDADKVYTYSGIQMIPKAWTPTLLRIKNAVETISGQGFNSVLLNQYRDGKDSMGFHRDNEPELGPQPVIASVSFGAVRRFRWRHYQRATNPITHELEDGSLLLMRGWTQKNWEHALPKTAKPVGVRVNLTFRHVR